MQEGIYYISGLLCETRHNKKSSNMYLYLKLRKSLLHHLNLHPEDCVRLQKHTDTIEGEDISYLKGEKTSCENLSQRYVYQLYTKENTENAPVFLTIPAEWHLELAQAGLLRPVFEITATAEPYFRVYGKELYELRKAELNDEAIPHMTLPKARRQDRLD